MTNINKKLKDFRLSGIINSLDLRIKQAESDNLGYLEFLELLLEDESNQRTSNKRKRLYHNAKLPFQKGLEDFDFTFQPSINKKQILNLAVGQFIKDKHNVIFMGQPGTGKTHLSVALGLRALTLGHSVLFTSVWDMVNILQQSRADLVNSQKLDTN
jgi:DNA replication protein DnaC